MGEDLLRIVLDTNIVVRALSSRSLAGQIFDSLFMQKFVLCISTEILLEYEEKIIQLYDKETAELFIASVLLLPNTIRTEIFYDLRLIVSDFEDDKFANCAFATNAHYLVSDDKHFSVLKKIDFPKIQVLKYKEFKEILTTI